MDLKYSLDLIKEEIFYLPEKKVTKTYRFKDDKYKIEFILYDNGEIYFFTEGCVVPMINLDFLDALVQELKKITFKKKEKE